MSEEENNQENKTSSADTSSNVGDAGQQKAVVKHVVAPPPPPPSARVSPFVSAKKDKKASGGKEKVSSGKWDNNFAADLKLPPSVLQTKNMAMIAGGLLMIGLLIGSVVFSGGNSCPPCTMDNFGVVRNPDVPKNTKRCGVANLDENCRLLMTNAKRSEIKVRELFPLAVQFTNVAGYRIDAMNIRYANEIIKPGYIAEVYIPPVAK